jgi:hypothetical protein
MPRFCESRIEPFNIWTMGEKIAVVDFDGRQTQWVEEEMERVAAFWNSRKNKDGDGLLLLGHL